MLMSPGANFIPIPILFGYPVFLSLGIIQIPGHKFPYFTVGQHCMERGIRADFERLNGCIFFPFF